jgi:hypothetical protein
LVSYNIFKIQHAWVCIMQDSTGAYNIHLFEDADLGVIYGKRKEVDIMPKDILFALLI